MNETTYDGGGPMHIAVRSFQQTTWAQRLFLVVVGCNIALILFGIRVVPSAITSLNGIGSLLGAVCMQLALAALALAGPVSFQRYPSSIRISFALGGVFAVLYLGDIVVDFNGGSDPINIIGIFIGVALVAGFVGCLITRQWGQGMIAAIWAPVIGTAIWSAGVMIIYYLTWGSSQQYLFWQGDGAIDDFHRSGETDLYAFLLHDIQGALTFHPLLSVVIGAIGGLVGSSIAWGILLLWHSSRGNLNHP
jgi:hypothetical protein